MHLLKPAVVFFVGSLTTPALAQRTSDIQVDRGLPPGTAYASSPASVAAAGNLYVAWMDNRNGKFDIYFNRTDDGGYSWLANDVRLDLGSAPGAAHSRDPQIQVSGNTIVVCWRDARASSSVSLASIYCNRSLDGGLTWMPSDVRINTGVAPGQSLAMLQTISCEGSEVFVTWEDTRSGGRDIYFNRSSDSGATWMANDIRIDTGDLAGSANSFNARHAIDGSKIHVVWQDLRNSSFSADIYYNRSLDAGATWLPAAVPINHSPAITYQGAISPRIAVAGDSVYVMWQDNPSDPGLVLLSRDIFFNRSLDQGTTWLPTDTRLNTSAPAGSYFTEWPDLCASGNQVFAVWIDRRHPRTVAFNRSLDSGSTWLPMEVPISHSPPNTFPIIDTPRIVSSGPLLLATWADSRSGNFDIFCNSSDDSGTTWLQANQRIDTGSPAGVANSFLPIPVLDNTSPYIVWEDGRNSEQHIFLNLPFGHIRYGDGLAGSGGFMPRISSQGIAKHGQTITMPISNGLGGAPSILALGLQKAFIPLFSGVLLVDPLVTSWLALGGGVGVPGDGTAAPAIALPSSSAFIGVAIFGQAFVFDAGAPSNLSMSPGVELWIG
jgi:hypothetical protein